MSILKTDQTFLRYPPGLAMLAAIRRKPRAEDIARRIYVEKAVTDHVRLKPEDEESLGSCEATWGLGCAKTSTSPSARMGIKMA